MSNPAFIIDGFTEKLIIQKICPGHRINRTDLNGKDVALHAIAKRISTLIRLLGNKYHPIVILIDKESREDSCVSIIEQLSNHLQAEGVNVPYIIGVADRMLENWIIADWESLETEVEKPENTDGCNGSAYLKRVKGSYSKTTDGVKLFLNANHSTIYRNSESFRNFIDKLNEISCPFLQFER